MAAQRGQPLAKEVDGVDRRRIAPKPVQAVLDDIQQVARDVQRMDEPVANVTLESERSRVRYGFKKVLGAVHEVGGARLGTFHGRVFAKGDSGPAAIERAARQESTLSGRR